jgi:aldehyde dehydrogenase (NAD+)
MLDQTINLELQSAFETLKSNRWNISQTSYNERKNKLERLKNVILKKRSAIAEALYLDFNKPAAEGELTEIHTCLDEINFAMGHLKKWMKPHRVKTPLVLFGTSSQIRYEAKGVVLILSPWNYPFSLMINPLVAAVAAGNCVMARPSEKTTHTGRILKEVIEEVFPSNEVFVSLGDIPVAQQMIKLPFDHIFFTGSIGVGRAVMMEAAKNLTPVTLELGGKSPAIVDKEVDLEDAVKKLVWGKFVNGGQTCVAPDYVYIPTELKKSFIEYFEKEVSYRYGDTSLERLKNPDFARIIDLPAFDRLNKKLDNETRLFHDQPLREERYIPPTLLTEVKPTSPIMEDEIFGPILPLLTYDHIDEVISYIRKESKPLALYVFSKRKSFIESVLKQTTSGGVTINNVLLHLANPHLPFGGVGFSGMGSYHGFFGFKTFSHERAVLKQSRLNIVEFFFPPYQTWLKQTALKLLRFLE